MSKPTEKKWNERNHLNLKKPRKKRKGNNNNGIG